MKNVRELTLCSVLLCILFVQEQVLMILPNIQFTGFLIILYSKILGFRRTTLIILCHVLLDNLVMGTFNYTVMPFMFIGWFIIPLSFHTFMKKVESIHKIAFFGFIQGFLYCWILIPSGLLFTGADFKPYLIVDIPFQIILAVSNALAILWLYKPLKRVLEKMVLKYEL